MPKRYKRKYKKVPFADAPKRDCTQCANCEYLGEGDFLCDVRMKLVIQDWDMSTAFRKCNTFIQEN